MTTSEARKIIESLAEGRCPTSGQKFPADSAYQQPDAVRALFLAVRALERMERLEKRAGTLPDQAGRPWDEAEEQRLCEGFAAGKTITELAKAHERTRGAIQARLERLGNLPRQPRV
jgi:hypothetical protein